MNDLELTLQTINEQFSNLAIPAEKKVSFYYNVLKHICHNGIDKELVGYARDDFYYWKDKLAEDGV